MSSCGATLNLIFNAIVFQQLTMLLAIVSFISINNLFVVCQQALKLLCIMHTASGISQFLDEAAFINIGVGFETIGRGFLAIQAEQIFGGQIDKRPHTAELSTSKNFLIYARIPIGWADVAGLVELAD